METKVIKIHEDKLENKILKECGEALRNGKLVVFPTETVYGLGANALKEDAVKKIFEAKGRPQDNPLIVHISELEEIAPLVEEVPKIAYKLMEKFWPGPMTIILPKSSLVPSRTSGGLNSVGIRMPSNKIARKLIKEAKVPIAAPSANISGRPSPTNIETCIEDLKGKVDYIIGGEKCDVGVESTVIDCTIYPPCVLRPGGITLEMLKNIDNKIYIDPAIMTRDNKDLKPKAPGMKYRHYAPKAELKIINGTLKNSVKKIRKLTEEYESQGKSVGIMATDETKEFYVKGQVISLGSRDNLETITRNLFSVLRSFDSKNVDIILSEAFEEKGIGIAIMNRLKKSAGFNIIEV
ncbi:L-threonylcarbamoyladenylate synthase [Clostridium tetani]|uniref:Threonylcarbamoyl-AMP synthase n=1 Tax=Clostridium tetani TaxID=1513 RepID=A0ABY0ESM9_CLOTA|nr:L-threonylcarbamoyladenylate synthase [Clostridium tetani]KHO40267.1 tRNA threonylcarbamoyladenosine biosynthesis protein [Clostridium tetani]RXI58538.1 threonylcarbamoyl-AMP synthase [Clostridium tetani]RXI73250.1 threonylcarbamoyl-AMP synthase [Clostridium tetani]CDI48363.1 SUA5 protein [Clostridium tetani 12124569]